MASGGHAPFVLPSLEVLWLVQVHSFAAFVMTLEMKQPLQVVWI